MSDKQRIADLERRVRELEARPEPAPITIIVQPSPYVAPMYPTIPVWPGTQPHPFGEPWITYHDGHSVVYS